jgi:hypothetical protein
MEKAEQVASMLTGVMCGLNNVHSELMALSSPENEAVQHLDGLITITQMCIRILNNEGV